ncbi:MAG TPA: bestrophin family protein [Gemmataceae bacterium]|jgi:putative membrane protein|nr:bestrophin family protein [Gemmataceae bacterium]
MADATKKHRSFGAFVRIIWPPLPVWRRLDLAVTAVAIYTTVVVLIDLAIDIHLPDWSGASTFLNALVLGILLAFRNKEAYDRWWEGRKLWGQLINDSRSLSAKLAALAQLSAVARGEVGRLIPGFAVALKNRLRDESDLRRIPGFETETAEPPHVPLYLFARLTALLQRERSAGRLSEVDLLTLDPHVRGLMDVCGACERIKSSPLPLSYRSLLKHGLIIYLTTTPWLVADHLGWWSIPVVSLFTYFLLGVELTAEDVEEPFGRDGDDLSLSTYCETIRRSTEQVFASTIQA